MRFVPLLPQVELPFALNTDDYIASLTASEPRIRHISLPEVQGTPTTQTDFLGLVNRNIPTIRKTILDLVSSSSQRHVVAGLILDFFCVGMIDIARFENIPCYIYMAAIFAYLGILRYLR